MKKSCTQQTKTDLPMPINVYLEPLKHYKEEHLVSVYLDEQGKVKGFHGMRKSAIAADPLGLRDFFEPALMHGAYRIILAQNRLGLSVAPTEEDKQITRKLIAIGEIIGMQIIDHYLVNAESMCSLTDFMPEFWGNEESIDDPVEDYCQFCDDADKDDE